MITIMVDENDDHAAWAEEYGLTHPVVKDNGFAQQAYVNTETGQYGLPTFALLNRELEVVAHFREGAGALSEDQVRTLVERSQPELGDWIDPDDEELDYSELLDGVALPGASRNGFVGESGPSPYGGCALDVTDRDTAGAPWLLAGLLALLGLRRRFSR